MRDDGVRNMVGEKETEWHPPPTRLSRVTNEPKRASNSWLCLPVMPARRYYPAHLTAFGTSYAAAESENDGI